MNPGGALRRARRRAGLTQAELAGLANTPQSTVGRIEAGLTMPRLDTYARLLALCGTRLTSVAGPKAGTPNDPPSFLWDLDMNRAQFTALLRDADPVRRGWAYSRLLGEADWQDVWSLVSLKEVKANLPLTHFRTKCQWEYFVAHAG